MREEFNTCETCWKDYESGRCAPCVRLTSEYAEARGRLLGAAAAFGLMGMAEAIRENAPLRYERVCRWCETKIAVGEYCDGRCFALDTGIESGGFIP